MIRPPIFSMRKMELFVPQYEELARGRYKIFINILLFNL